MFKFSGFFRPPVKFGICLVSTIPLTDDDTELHGTQRDNHEHGEAVEHIDVGSWIELGGFDLIQLEGFQRFLFCQREWFWLFGVLHF